MSEAILRNYWHNKKIEAKKSSQGGWDKYSPEVVEKAEEAVEESYGEKPGKDASEAEQNKWYGTKHEIAKKMQKKSRVFDKYHERKKRFQEGTEVPFKEF